MSPIRICEEVNSIGAPIDRVWDVVSDFGGIDLWMPAVNTVSVEGHGVGAIRSVTGGPMTIQERLESYNPETYSFSYRVINLPGLPIRGSISLSAKDEQTTEMTYLYDIEEIDDGVRETIATQSVELINASIAKLKEVLGNTETSKF